MAYACPVCEQPQVDAEHLANHLAFTAIAGDADHEAWLDEVVGEWSALGEAELADAVVDHADEIEFPVDVDAATGGDHDHAPDGERAGRRGGQGPPAPAPDEDVEEVLDEARDLTRRMRGGDADAADGEGHGAEDDDGAEDAAGVEGTDADEGRRSDNETQ